MSLFHMIETTFVFPCLPMKEVSVVYEYTAQECRAMTSKLLPHVKKFLQLETKSMQI